MHGKIAFRAWRGAGRSSLESLMALSSGSASYATDASLRSPLDLLRRIITPTASDPAYATHVPLSPLQRGALGVLASLGAAADPRRGDLVAVVGETTGVAALRSIRARMARSEEGRALLADRPHITDATVAPCWDLPPSTFGGAYAQFMGARGFRADERPRVRFLDDPELAWIAARAREVHDFWHVLFNCHTDVFGETALKAVEFVQTGLPMTAMAVAAGAARMRPSDRQTLAGVYLPWAVRAGAQAADLMTIYYERHFEYDLEEVRRQWRIEAAPPGAPARGTQNAKPGSPQAENTV